MGRDGLSRFLAQWKTHFYGRNAANFGWGGDTTQNILSPAKRRARWCLAEGDRAASRHKQSAWAGPADKAKVDEVVTGIKAIIGVFQQHAPEAAIVLTGVFPRSQNMSLKETIEQINTQLSKLDDGKKIRFLNINDKLADTEGKLLEGMSSDGLHLEAKGYDVWAEALKPILTEIMGPPAAEDPRRLRPAIPAQRRRRPKTSYHDPRAASSRSPGCCPDHATNCEGSGDRRESAGGFQGVC